MQIRAHSPRTFSIPRKRNCRNPRACLICPKTGSTMNLRVAYTAAPTFVSSFRSMRSTRLASLGKALACRALCVDCVSAFPPLRILPFFSWPGTSDFHPSNTRCRPELLPVSVRTVLRSPPPTAPSVVCRWPLASPSALRSAERPARPRSACCSPAQIHPTPSASATRDR